MLVYVRCLTLCWLAFEVAIVFSRYSFLPEYAIPHYSTAHTPLSYLCTLLEFYLFRNVNQLVVPPTLRLTVTEACSFLDVGYSHSLHRLVVYFNVAKGILFIAQAIGNLYLASLIEVLAQSIRIAQDR